MYLEKNIVDEFYFKEKKYLSKPKYTTLLLYKIIKGINYKKSKIKFIDIGCANGAAIYYLKDRFNFQFIGTDVDKRFQKNFPKKSNIEFFCDDIKSKNKKKIYGDLLYCSGVLSLFNDPKKLINGLIERTNQKGKIIITSMLNPYHLDLIIRFRNNLAKENKINGEGWNLHSINYLTKILKKNKKIRSFKFIKTKFPKNIKINPIKNDPLRSWTINYKKENFFMNGLCLIQYHYFLVINVK